MLKPPIARMGGKSKLRKTIIEMLPEHTCYVELFMGAGWVYFGKEPSKVEVVNDIDRELINLFKMLKYHAPEIERLLQYEFSGRDIFNEYKHATLGQLTEIHRAIRFLYVISQSFASKGCVYGYAPTAKPPGNIYYTDLLHEIRERLKNTYAENLPFETVIEKYDRPGTVFFADPPYYNLTAYSGYPFKKADHLLLRDKLANIQGKFLLTINDCPEVREWYCGFNIKEVTVPYSICRDIDKRKHAAELIITNYVVE